MAVFMQPIYTQTVGAGGAASVTFNNIPQSYKDLVIVGSTRTTNASALGYIGVRLNGDSGTNYSYVMLDAYTSAYTFATAAPGFNCVFGGTNGNSTVASSFGDIRITIPDYTKGAFKAIQLDSTTADNTATAVMDQIAGQWRSTAPVTSITLADTLSPANFAQYSSFTLYGVTDIYDSVAPVAPTIGAVTDQAGFAAVAFTPAASDRADSYKVTSSPSGSTTYGTSSPIKTPATLNTAYTYQVEAVNSLGSTPSAASASLTTANSYTSIATVAFTNSSTAAAYFTNIPQHYKHLQLRCFVRVVSSQSTPYDLTVTVNGSNTSGDYTYHMMRGDGASTSLAGVSTDNVLRFPVSVPNGSMTSNVFGALIIDILDYNDTSKNKTARAIFGYDNGSGSSPTAGWTGLSSSAWYSTAPIANLIVASFGNFAQYSHVALYGIA